MNCIWISFDWRKIKILKKKKKEQTLKYAVQEKKSNSMYNSNNYRPTHTVIILVLERELGLWGQVLAQGWVVHDLEVLNLSWTPAQQSS